MTTQTQTTIRRRPDGSIDTAFYQALGRQARSRQAHQMLDRPVRSAGRPALLLTVLAALILPATGRM